MNDRDWDNDFDLGAWQALDPSRRKEWIEQAWMAERDDQDSSELWRAQRQRYERGQTAWDIGLEPQPFDIVLAEAVGEVKPEHWDGRVFGSRDVRLRVLSALLANAGLRRTVRLAPRQLWEAVVATQARSVAYERALADDRAAGTHTAVFERRPPPEPVVRPEYVVASQADVDWPFYWVRHAVAQPFIQWDMHRRGEATDWLSTQVGYVAVGDRTLARVDILVFRHPWRPHRGWPSASEAALAIFVANGPGPLSFDWWVRRPALLRAGTQEVWVVDTDNRRVLRQRLGETPGEVRYTGPGQTLIWREDFDEVVVEFDTFFGHLPATAQPDHSEPVAFETFSAEQLERLHRFETPWTTGYTPQWFNSPIGELLIRFKDEFWDGVLFGPEYLRDSLLSALLANVGLDTVIALAPLHLWQEALL